VGKGKGTPRTEWGVGWNCPVRKKLKISSQEKILTEPNTHSTSEHGQDLSVLIRSLVMFLVFFYVEMMPFFSVNWISVQGWGIQLNKNNKI
jgi:hypothetical protein